MIEIIATYGAQQIEAARARRDEIKESGRQAFLTRTPGARGIPDTIHLHAETKPTVRRLSCCVCGEDAGRYQQWWNRDTGWGICRKCVDWQRARGTSDAEMRDLYGHEGVHYAAA